MGKYFSDKAEEGIRLVWMQFDRRKIREGALLLAEAAKEGDADALCFTARTLMGPQYIWEYAGTPTDERKAVDLLRKSILLGSSCGVLIAMRCGELTQEIRENMPFSSLQEARDIVLEKAQAGHPFCQYMIGNTYFWGDIFEIDGLDPQKLYANDTERDADLARKAIPWLESSLRGGVYMGLGNLYNIYAGKNGLPGDTQKWLEILQTCAEQGAPMAQQWYGDLLFREKHETESLHWYEAAAQQGQLSAWDKAGWQYEKGLGVQASLEKAAQYYQNGAEGGLRMAQFHLGRLYYFGAGINQDYAQAVRWLEKAVQRGNKNANPLLGDCYLRGLGTTRDPAHAKKCFDDTPKDAEYRAVALNGLGEIYAEGLTVLEDIPRGIDLFEQAAELGSQEAKDNLKKYKKTIFGKWKRR